MKPVHPAFAALVAESKRVGYPTAFKRDLTFHDRRWVSARDPKAPFMWALRENGTHAWDIELKQGDTTAVSFIASIAQCHPEVKFYLWDGVALQAFDNPGHARDALAAFLEAESERKRAALCRGVPFCHGNFTGEHVLSCALYEHKHTAHCEH